MHSCLIYIDVRNPGGVSYMHGRHSGIRFRRDSISILCDPLYRGTLLRDVLTATTQVDGVPFLQQYGAMGAQAAELMIAHRSDGLITERSSGGEREDSEEQIPSTAPG